jgi:cytoskeletal protein CcmA (bactofilin family)
MALWKEPPQKSPSGLPEGKPQAARFDAPAPPVAEPKSEIAAMPPVIAPVRAPANVREKPKSESLIAPDIAIEGKIEGSGHVRIAGRFKGDVDVRGDLTIEAGAKVNGSVRAEKIVVSGELVGNIEAASHVDLMQSGSLVGDLKAASLTVAAGSRMRGQADFGWEESKSTETPRKNGNGSDHGSET